MKTYVAFLRGINVGGHKSVKMSELKIAMEALGFTKVRTVLASGNVIFDAAKEAGLAAKIEAQLEKSFGMTIGVLVRPMEALRALVAEGEGIAAANAAVATRLYVTFLPEEPWQVFNVITVEAGRATVDLMADLEKKYGKKITTRNWNTLGKILRA